MKIIIASVFIVAFVYAELPPSNSYLPPSPGSNGGYPHRPSSTFSQSFLPEVVAARTLGGPHSGSAHGVGAHSPINPFGRSSNAAGSHATGRFGSEAPNGYNSNGYARNALEQNSAEPANYNFGYMVNDYQEGTNFGHYEERLEDRAQGEYHVVLPDGRRQTVSYQADERGFKPQISYEETESLGRSSGYDTNAHNFRNSVNHGNNGQDRFGARSNGY